MRIISGIFKGKRIEFLKTLKTRPLKDSVKENLFNILMHSNQINLNLKSSEILDLYSGIGSFGLECISRGAKKVTFVEKDILASSILNKNLTNLSAGKKAKVIVDNIFNIKDLISNEKYKIFFLDPPFSDSQFIEVLHMIRDLKIYNKEHVVIIHRENKSKDNISNILEIKLEKNYGRSKIIIGKFI